ncbi:unnamed protein product, partial [Mesorhabditis belari]|uniref:VWFA domain-containing protein n=1 Tax=Mesorhabditis belari TaxID=2138241 RepID=A0AAF3EUF4_9BILA
MITRKAIVFHLWLLFILPCYAKQLMRSSLSEDYFSIGAHLSADGLSRALRGTLNDLLLQNEALKHVESLNYEKIEVNPMQILNEMTEGIDGKLGEIKRQLSKIAENTSLDGKTVKNSCRYVTDPLRSSIKPIGQCCSNVENGGNFVTNENLTSNLLREPFVDSFFLYNSQQFAECPPRRIPVKRSHNWKAIGVGLREVQRQDRHERKDVVIAIDLGGITSDGQLNRVKNTAKLLLELGLEKHRYTVIVNTINGLETQCNSNLKTLQDFVDQIKLPDAHLKSSHPEIVEAATGLWENSTNVTHILHYFSRGMLSELSEAPKTLEVLAKRFLDLPYHFRVNTFAIGDENRTPLLWSTEFLQSISQLDFTRYRQSMSDQVQQRFNGSEHFPTLGKLILLNGSEAHELQLNTLLELTEIEKSTKSEDQVFSYYANGFEKLTVMRNQKNLLIGGELDVRILIDSILTHNLIVFSPKVAQLEAYFLDFTGNVIASSKTISSKVSLSDLDDWANREHQVTSRFSKPDLERGEFSVITRANTKREYLWQKLHNGPFVVLLGYLKGKFPEKLHLKERLDRQLANFDHLVYYQFNLQRDLHHQCAYHGSLAVSNKASLFLSFDSFEPFARKSEISEQLVVNYWVYLTDRIGFFRSSAMKEGIREEAAILAIISKMWIGLEKNPSVIRRFAATRRGLFVTQPAAVLEPKFDPRTQEWYISAMESPGKISIIGPVADPILGDFVIVSTTISIENQEVLVIGVEISMYYLTHIIQRSVPSCNEGRRCLLLSKNGNALSIPDELLKKISVDAVERYHIAHVDPVLASHLLASKSLFAKSECKDVNGQLNHQFHFNLTFNRVLSNGCFSTAPHRQSLHSEVLLVPQTNAFLVLINETCSMEREKESGHFCPCSVSDRRCWFCERFDVNECECPCSCTFTDKSTCGKEELMPPRVPICRNSPHTFELMKAPSFLEECQPTKCETIQKQLPCDLTAGCTWCHSEMKENKAKELLTAKCLPIPQCYRGVLGRSVNTLKSEQESTPPPLPTTPLSLIVALIFFIVILILIATLCYKNRVSRLRERRICSTDPSGGPLCARFNSLDPNEDFYFDHEGLSREKLVVLASFERSNGPANRIDQPQRGPVSDLGYSTMTEKTGEDSDAGITSSHPTVRLRMNDGGTRVPGRSCSAHLSRLIESPKRQSRFTDFAHCSPYNAHIDSNIPSSSSSVVTTEVDIHQPPSILPQLIE